LLLSATTDFRLWFGTRGFRGFPQFECVAIL